MYFIMWYHICYMCSSCRFTVRVDELLRVLKDLQVGRYQRTMVSSKPAEEQDNGTYVWSASNLNNYVVVTVYALIFRHPDYSSLDAIVF